MYQLSIHLIKVSNTQLVASPMDPKLHEECMVMSILNTETVTLLDEGEKNIEKKK